MMQSLIDFWVPIWENKLNSNNDLQTPREHTCLAVRHREH